MKTFRVALIVSEANWNRDNMAKVVEVKARSLAAALASVMGDAELVMEEADYLAMLD